MSHRDPCRRNSFPAGAQDLKAVISWLLAAADFGGLVIMALLWVWSEEVTLMGRFSAVLQIAGRLWPQDVPQAISYQAFTKRLVRWTAALLVQDARHPWYLVTSVCDARQLSDHDVVEIYRRRWGVELF